MDVIFFNFQKFNESMGIKDDYAKFHNKHNKMMQIF